MLRCFSSTVLKLGLHSSAFQNRPPPESHYPKAVFSKALCIKSTSFTDDPLQRSSIDKCKAWQIRTAPWRLWSMKLNIFTEAGNTDMGLACFKSLLSKYFYHQAPNSSPQWGHYSVNAPWNGVVWYALWGNDGLKENCSSINMYVYEEVKSCAFRWFQSPLS